MMSSKHKNLRQLILAAMFLTLALALPFLTGQIPQVGSALCPMHIPVLLCGFFCGPWYALAVGLVAPVLRLALFGLPPLMPTVIAMCFELATYGFVSGLLYKLLPGKKVFTYVTLIAAMLAGRIIWGIARVILAGLAQSEFAWTAFLSGAFVNAVPGIILHILLIPVLVIALKRYTETGSQAQ